MKTEEEDFFKIGVSSANEVEALWRIRFSHFVDHSVDLRAFIPFDSMEEAEQFERRINSIKRASPDLHYSPQKLFGGGEGECLKEDIFEKIFANDEAIYEACKEKTNQIMYSDAFMMCRPEDIVEHCVEILDVFIFQGIYEINETLKAKTSDFQKHYTIDNPDFFDMTKVFQVAKELVLDPDSFTVETIPENWKNSYLKHMENINQINNDIEIIRALADEDLLKRFEKSKLRYIHTSPFINLFFKKEQIAAEIDKLAEAYQSKTSTTIPQA